MLTNEVVSFEQPGPGEYIQISLVIIPYICPFKQTLWALVRILNLAVILNSETSLSFA